MTDGHRWYLHLGQVTNTMYVVPAVVLLLVFLCYPLFLSFRLSGYAWDLVSPERFVGLNNFVRLAGDSVFWKAVRNTVQLAVVGPLIQTALALVLAVLIAESGRWKVLYRTAVFAPVMLALVAVGLIWMLIYNPVFGLINSALEAIGLGALTRVWIGDPDTALPAIIVITIWRWTGFNIVIYLAGLQALPQEVYEAAKLDGATRWQQFIHITVPLIAPFTFLNFLINIIGYIKLFDIVFVTTKGGPDHATELLSTYIYKQAFEFFNIGGASAAAVVLFLITSVVVFAFFLLARWLSGQRGVTS